MILNTQIYFSRLWYPLRWLLVGPLMLSLVLSPIAVSAQIIPAMALGARVLMRTVAGSAVTNYAINSLNTLGLGLGAVLIYNKLNPSETDTPITQVNVDSKARPLTQIEKDAGFTTGASTTSQDVQAPAVSTVNPQLYSANGGGSNFAQSGLPCTDWASGAGSYKSQGTTGIAYTFFDTATAPTLSLAYGYNSLESVGVTCTMPTAPTQRVVYRSRSPCGAGYSVNGSGVCTLMTNNLVKLPVDGTCQITRAGNVYTVSNQDPDCIGNEDNPQPTPVFTNGGGTLSFYSSADLNSGKPSGIQISSTASQTDISVSTPSSDGTATYQRDYLRTSPITTGTGQATVTTSSRTRTNGVGDAATVVQEAVVSGGGGGTIGGATSTDVTAVNTNITDFKTKSETNSTAIKTAIETNTTTNTTNATNTVTAINAQTVATQAATQAIQDAKTEATVKAQAIQDKIDLATAKSDSWWSQLLTKLGIISDDVKDIKTSVTVAPQTPFGVDQNLVIDQSKVGVVATAVGDGSVLPSLFSFSPILPATVEPPVIQFNILNNVVALDISTYLKYVRVFLGLVLYVTLPFSLFNIYIGYRYED